MKIVFYHSVLCPRCLLVGRTLQQLQDEFPDLAVEKIEVTRQPLASLRSGIRMIPALTAGDSKLSGLYLSPAAVRQFVEKTLQGRFR